MIKLIRTLSIQNPESKQQDLLDKFYYFLEEFEGKPIIMSIKTKYDKYISSKIEYQVYYKGTYNLLEFNKSFIDKFKNCFFEDLSNIYLNSFIINIKDMDISDLKKTIGKEILIPKNLKMNVDKKEKFDIIKNSNTEVKNYILSKIQ